MQRRRMISWEWIFWGGTMNDQNMMRGWQTISSEKKDHFHFAFHRRRYISLYILYNIYTLYRSWNYQLQGSFPFRKDLKYHIKRCWNKAEIIFAEGFPPSCVWRALSSNPPPVLSSPPRTRIFKSNHDFLLSRILFLPTWHLSFCKILSRMMVKAPKAHSQWNCFVLDFFLTGFKVKCPNFAQTFKE